MKKYFPALFAVLTILGMGSAMGAESVRTTPLPGTVALTFDDGPSPVYTPQVLKILRQQGIHATFFVVGANAKQHPELLHAIAADGNPIANHSMTHPKLTQLGSQQLQYQIADSKKVIASLLKASPSCFRPPYGLINQHIAGLIRQNGMIPVPIGYNSYDYARPGVQKLIHNVVSRAHSGMVILLHDGYKNKQQTVDALPGIIAGIQKKGLGFSTICPNIPS